MSIIINIYDIPQNYSFRFCAYVEYVGRWKKTVQFARREVKTFVDDKDEFKRSRWYGTNHNRLNTAYNKINSGTIFIFRPIIMTDLLLNYTNDIVENTIYFKNFIQAIAKVPTTIMWDGHEMTPPITADDFIRLNNESYLNFRVDNTNIDNNRELCPGYQMEQSLLDWSALENLNVI